jgi:hypothetical protein
VLYEVESLDTLTSAPYLERLNNPTPWTTKVMPHYRGMDRGLCSVVGSFGFGTGHVCGLIRFKPGPAALVHRWLLTDTLPSLPARTGLGSAHLLQGTSSASMTNEQRLRGEDGRVHSALIVTGYDQSAVETATQAILADLDSKGADGATFAIYQLAYSLAHAEVHA